MARKTRRGASYKHCLQSELMSETLPKIYMKGRDWRKAKAGFEINCKGSETRNWGGGRDGG